MAQEKINPWVNALRILFTLALIWAVVFIFSNSMEVAQVSTAHSDEECKEMLRLMGMPFTK